MQEPETSNRRIALAHACEIESTREGVLDSAKKFYEFLDGGPKQVGQSNLSSIGPTSDR